MEFYVRVYRGTNASVIYISKPIRSFFGVLDNRGEYIAYWDNIDDCRVALRIAREAEEGHIYYTRITGKWRTTVPRITGIEPGVYKAYTDDGKIIIDKCSNTQGD